MWMKARPANSARRGCYACKFEKRGWMRDVRAIHLVDERWARAARASGGRKRERERERTG